MIVRRVVRLLILLVALTSIGLAGAPAAARAAETDVRIVSDARYDVLPDKALVRVSADLTIEYLREETRTRRFFIDHAFLAVMPGTRGFRVSGDGDPTVRVSRRTSAYTLLRIDLGTRLYGGGSRAVRLRFDLPDPGGEPTRELRVSDALITFPVWAFASDGAGPSTVTVVAPPDYDVEVGAGPLPERVTAADGRQVLRSGAIAEPGTFFAFVVGEGPGAFVERHQSVLVDGEPVGVRLRAWSDDPEWAERVGGILEEALPVLADATGLSWRGADPLVVEESSSRSTTAFAGRFDPAEGRIEIAYYADPFVILHEAAHAWFNGDLLGDRWANEGFASLYAEAAAGTLGIEISPDALTDELRAVAVPLNAWDPAEGASSEAYGYAAALELARAIRQRAGDDVLRRVWTDAAAHVGAYQPPAQVKAVTGEEPQASGSDAAAGAASSAAPELEAEPPDWRGLLDLLEERTGGPFDDLWRRWVVRPGEAALLDARAATRSSYRRTLALADDWALPRGVRDALRAWRFETAETWLADLRVVIAQRDALESAATRADIALPTVVRDAFEAGRLTEASASATAQLDTIDVITGAEAARPADPDPVTRIGLWERQPDVDIAAARAALASGDVEGAVRSAEAALVAWDQAWDLGRRRILVALAALATALLLLLGLVAVAIHRRLRRSVSQAHPVRDRPHVKPPPTPAG